MNWWNVLDEGMGFGLFGVCGMLFSVHGWLIGFWAGQRSVRMSCRRCGAPCPTASHLYCGAACSVRAEAGE